jgi:hypothetical protein
MINHIIYKLLKKDIKMEFWENYFIDSYINDRVDKLENLKDIKAISTNDSINFIKDYILKIDDKKDMKDFNLSDVIQKINNSKTPNDFGFHKRSFNTVFLKDRLKELTNKNVKRDISENHMDNAFSELRRKDAETIDLLVILKTNKKETEEKESIDSEIKIFSEKRDKTNKKTGESKQEDKSTGRINENNHKNEEYFGAKVLATADEYGRHSDVYRIFMDAYLYNSSQEKKYSSSDMFGLNQRKDDSNIPSDEIISYKEKTEYIKAIMMNALMHAPMNHIDPKTKDRYEAWKLSSKFYEQLSFLYYDNILSPG